MPGGTRHPEKKGHAGSKEEHRKHHISNILAEKTGHGLIQSERTIPPFFISAKRRIPLSCTINDSEASRIFIMQSVNEPII